MSSREALLAMQERLARRLQAGPAEDGQACWLAVHAGRHRYLLPLAQAGEIFPYAAPQRVPYTHDWFLGVAHLRGGLWAAVDLAAFVGEEAPSPAGAPGTGPRAGGPQVAEEARLVTFHAQLELNGALRVDRLAGLRGPEDFPSSTSPPAPAPAWFGPRYSDAQGQVWQALSLAALARDPRFLSLAV